MSTPRTFADFVSGVEAMAAPRQKKRERVPPRNFMHRFVETFGVDDGGPLKFRDWDESKHPRGKTGPGTNDGSFAPGDGTTAGDREVISELKNLAESKGFSIHPITGERASTWLMVSLPVGEKLIDLNSDEPVTAETIRQWREQYAEQFEKHPSAFIGGWVDVESGKLALDISVNYTAAERARAIDDAIDGGQKAIYNLDTGSSEYVRDFLEEAAARGVAKERIERWRESQARFADHARELSAGRDGSGDRRRGERPAASQPQQVVAHTPDGRPRSCTVRAFTEAARRVHFSVIEQRTDAEAARTVKAASQVIARAVAKTLGSPMALRNVLESPGLVAGISLPGDDVGRLRRLFEESLSASWATAQEMAAAELERAKAATFRARFSWEENAHPRGKTSEESTPGSFAPSGADGQAGGDRPAGDGSGAPTGAGGRFDAAAWRAKGMKAARDEWAALGRAEKDAAANARETILARADEITGPAEYPNTGDFRGDLNAYVRMHADILPSEDAGLVTDYAVTLHDDLVAANVDEAEARQFSLDVTRLLIAQDFEAAGRTLGDHGIHHIMQDLRLARSTLEAMPGYRDDPRMAAGMAIAVALHDSGYMTPPARAFLDDQHPRWGAQFYSENFRDRVGALLGKDVADWVQGAIERHDWTGFDWERDPELSAVSLADNFALFHWEKMPPMLRHVPENMKPLVALGRGLISVDEARDAMRYNIDQSPLSDRMKAQLSSAVDEVSGVLPKFTLGMVGASVKSVSWDKDHPVVNIERRASNEALGRVLDLYNRQFRKLAETYHADPDEFARSGNLEIKNDAGRVLVRAIVSTPKYKNRKDMAANEVLVFADIRNAAASYIEANSFRMAGNAADAVRSIIQSELLNGIKFGTRVDEVRAKIWDRILARGLVLAEDIVESDLYLSEALGLDLLSEERLAHYIDTLVRTNTFEALNEARYAEFTAPTLGGFVVALEYSAILDARTTEICTALDGFTRAADDPLWDKYRPPNHYNCRSILIPITEIDDWTGFESDDPEVEPQVGFFTERDKRLVFHYPRGQEHEFAEWNEEDHPRHPPGSSDGGKFAPKDGDDEHDSVEQRGAHEVIKEPNTGEVLYSPRTNRARAAAYQKTGLPTRGVNALREHEAEIRANDYETFIVIDDEGKVAMALSGDEDSVDFSPSDIAQIKVLADSNDNLVYTHNHPGPYNNSFSEPDVETAMARNFAEARAITKAGIVYRMRRGPYGWPSDVHVFNEISRIAEDMHAEVERALLGKDYTTRNRIIGRANHTHYHELWSRLQQQFPGNIIYERIEPDTKAKLMTWDDMKRGR